MTGTVKILPVPGRGRDWEFHSKFKNCLELIGTVLVFQIWEWVVPVPIFGTVERHTVMKICVRRANSA